MSSFLRYINGGYKAAKHDKSLISKLYNNQVQVSKFCKFKVCIAPH